MKICLLIWRLVRISLVWAWVAAIFVIMSQWEAHLGNLPMPLNLLPLYYKVMLPMWAGLCLAIYTVPATIYSYGITEGWV